MRLFKRHTQVPVRKRGEELSLADAIIMPSGRAYAVRRVEWFGHEVAIEAAVPGTGNACVETLYVAWHTKFDVVSADRCA